MSKQIATKTGMLSSTHVVAVPVATTATVYTRSVLMGSGENFSLRYIATSDGTVLLKIELEISNVLPTTEGAADAVNYAVPENFADIESALADENLHYKNIAPPVAKYCRLKITGSGANDATTTLTATLIKQSDI